MVAGTFFLILNKWPPERDDDASCCRVEDFDEGHEQCINSSHQAKISSDLAAVGIAEVSGGEEKECDPEQKEDAPDAFAQTEGYDPQ